VNLPNKKDVLELCVLAMLSRRDCYGYDVSEAMTRTAELPEGAVYPILRGMKSGGLVTTYLSEDSGGPPRKYYRLTRLGREAYQSAKSEWLALVDNVGRLLKEEQDETV
jgi:PadR family transcriptional regulator PadR